MRIVGLEGGGQTEILDGLISKDVSWRADGKYALEQRYGEPTRLRCDWEPDIRELALPLQRSEWSSRSSCEPFEGLRIEHTRTSRVGGAAQIVAAGKTLAVWVIRTEELDRSVSAEETTERKTISRSYFAPEYGLTVRLITETKSTDPTSGEENTQTTTAELMSLTPS